MPRSNGPHSIGPRSNGKNGRSKGRRNFLKTLAAGALSLPASSARGREPEQAEAKPPRPNSAHRLAIEYPRTFTGRQRAMLAFPLGGVGAGSISLGGRGQLKEWWIFNRPDQGKSPGYAFPAIWVQARTAKPLARILEARIMPPYEGPSGLGSENVPGMPRLASCALTGEFPLVRVDFEDSILPVRVALEAFTPFVPLEADDSGLPVAVLRYQVANPGASKVTASIAFSIENPAGEGDGAASRVNDFRQGEGFAGLLMRNPFLAAGDPLAGTFALSVLTGGGGKVTYLRGWPSARWWQGPLLFWDDFSADGERGPEAPVRSAVGSICLQREIRAGGKAEYTFLLSWHFPNRTPRRCGWKAPQGHEDDLIGNHYCTRFRDAWEAAEYAARRLPDLEARTRRFVSALRGTTLPGAVKDAATATLSALVSPTSFRTADGGFHGFEGCNEHSGCCFGSCTHVWNYEAATASVFPTLARSLRERQFGFSTDAEGRMDFREMLPYGIEHFGVAAADGQMGSIMKLYYDWRLSGDTEWLRQLWPAAKRALEFAWIKGGWDSNRDGVMEGVQHNTYDVEFIGPNPLCGVWYLGALRAAEEMARALGDTESAEEYHRIFRLGSQWIDAHLFNGEFYIQRVGAVPQAQIAKGLQAGMGAADTEHPAFQLGEGCFVDQLVGQYFAQVAGLGLLLDRRHIQSALQSIYKYNYKRTLYDHESAQRTYALNDEAGLLICEYPAGKRPEAPFPYFAEVWTGLEYAAAALMLYMGMTAEGIEVIENSRRRYDGERRNPWDEAECGHYYARPMASWAPLLALSGFRYHGAEKSVVAQPRIRPERFSSFWSTASGWGTFSQVLQEAGLRFTLSIAHGRLECRSVTLTARRPAAAVSSAKLGTRPLKHALHREGSEARFEFSEEIALHEGDRLVLAL